MDTSLFISDDAVEIQNSSIFKPDHCILLSGKQCLLLEFSTKGIQKFMNYEIWSIQDKKILAHGKQDIFGISFLTGFKIYMDNLISVLISRSGEREILVFNFFTNEKISFSKNLPYRGYQLNSESHQYDIIPISKKDIIILTEKNFLRNEVAEEEGCQDYMILTLRVLNKNQNIAELTVRREYGKENEEMVILKGNEQCVIIADQQNGEVMLWDFIKYPKEPFYLQFDCSDYIFKYVYFDRHDNNQLIKFIYTSKIDHMVKVLIYNFTTKNTIVQALKPSNKELMYVGHILYSNLFFFSKCGILLTCNKYQDEPDSIYFNVYKKNNCLDTEFDAISDFKHRCDDAAFFMENPDYDYLVYQGTSFKGFLESKQKNYEFRMLNFKESNNKDDDDY